MTHSSTTITHSSAITNIPYFATTNVLMLSRLPITTMAFISSYSIDLHFINS